MNGIHLTGVLVLVALCWALVTGCGGADAGSGPSTGVSVSDSAGVRLVEFTGLGILGVPEVSTTVIGEIGKEGGTGLYRVSGARLLGSGRLAVGNSGTLEILYFDTDGALLRRVGREGDGPGEFRAITAFPATAGDTLTVYDVRLGRLTVLTGQGEVLETRSLEPPSRAVDLLPLTLGENDRVLAVHGEARIFAASGVRRDTVPLMVIDPPSTVDTLSLWPGKQWSFGSTDRGAFRTEVGFGYSVEASGRAGYAVVGSTDRLHLTVVNAQGDQIMQIEASEPNRSVSDEDVQRWREDRLAGLPDNVPGSIRRVIETAPHNETFPAFSGLLMDADRRIWIGETGEPGVVDRSWTVLEADGERAFRVVLSASAAPLDARGDRLVLLDQTDLGEEVIQILRLGSPE